jgi:hypothetical protein
MEVMHAHADLFRRSQDTLGDECSGSHASFWGPDQSIYVAQNGEGEQRFRSVLRTDVGVVSPAAGEYHQSLLPLPQAP